MEKVKEYVVVTAVGADKLNVLVNDYIRKGGIPLGGISTVMVTIKDGQNTLYGIQYSQAVVKY